MAAALVAAALVAAALVAAALVAAVLVVTAHPTQIIHGILNIRLRNR